MPALHEDQSELLFELADTAGKRRLRHVAGLRSAPEVTLPRQRVEVAELLEDHPPIITDIYGCCGYWYW